MEFKNYHHKNLNVLEFFPCMYNVIDFNFAQLSFVLILESLPNESPNQGIRKFSETKLVFLIRCFLSNLREKTLWKFFKLL